MNERADDRSLTGAQVRDARILLDWGLSDLARRCRFDRKNISVFEKTGRMPNPMFQRTSPEDRLGTLRAVLEAAGIEFLEPGGSGPSVRLRPGFTPHGAGQASRVRDICPSES